MTTQGLLVSGVNVQDTECHTLIPRDCGCQTVEDRFKPTTEATVSKRASIGLRSLKALRYDLIFAVEDGDVVEETEPESWHR